MGSDLATGGGGDPGAGAGGGAGRAAALARLLATAAIGVVQLVPALLAALLERPELSAARSLRLVFCGGAALPPALVGRFRERLPWAALHNLYGPERSDHRRRGGVVRRGGRDAGIGFDRP